MMAWLFRVAAYFGLPSWVIPALVVGFFMSALGGAYVKGRIDAAANCRERELKNEIATLRADLSAQKLAAEFEANNRKYLEQQNARNAQEMADYEKELQARARSTCALDGADIKRLRRIGGE